MLNAPEPRRIEARRLDEARAQANLRPALARRLAAEVLVLARQHGDHILEAEASLCSGYSLARCTDPAGTRHSLLHAERIFRAHGRLAQAAQCQLGAARALYFMGRPREALALCRAALQSTALPAWDRAHAHTLLFQTQGRLGHLVEAYWHLNERALPLARACGEPMLVSRVLTLKAWLFTRLLHSQQNTGLPLPALADIPDLEPGALDWGKVQRLFDEARYALPPGVQDASLAIDQEYARGLTRRNGAARKAARGLAQVARQVAADDPPAAAWAYFCQAMVLHDAGDLDGALAALPNALALAEPCRLEAMVRDLCYFRSLCLEAAGRTAEAFAALKQYVAGMLRESGEAKDAGPAATADPGAEPMHKLRTIEPACVKRAVRIVQQRIGEELTVAAIVQACAVSRRTLDSAFRSSRATTLSGYLRARQFEYAAEQLLHTQQPVRDIARSVGYRSPTMFSREFRRRMGLTPTQWRGAASDG